MTADRRQLMANLERANEARMLGARWAKPLLAEDPTRLREVLTHPGLQGHRLRTVLRWQPRYGPARIARQIHAAQIPATFLDRRLDKITDRQKDALAAWAETNGGGRRR